MAEAEAAPEAPKKKGKKGLLIIVLAAVLILGGGGAGAFFFLKGKGGASAASAKAAEKDQGKEHASAEGAAGEGKGHGQGADHGVLSLESFITNLADTEEDRYIKCTMRLALDKKETAEAIKADELSITRIRDRILTVLSSKTFNQIASSEGKEHLRQEIREQLDPLMDGGKVTDVYYTEFIVQ